MESPLLRVVSKLKRNTSSSNHRFRRRDDDLADQLNHTVTSALLLACTVVVSARQYAGGKAITCWVPSDFTRAQQEYAESICWVTSTYFVAPQIKSIPEEISRREETKLLYYQWVPFVLMMQTVLFNIPALFWRFVSWQTDIHLSTIMEISSDIDNIRDLELRQVSVSYLSRLIEQSLRQNKSVLKSANQKNHNLPNNEPNPDDQDKLMNYSNIRSKKPGYKMPNFNCIVWFSHRYGSFLTSLYFVTKLLYLINILGQFYLMARFLDINYTFYGLEMLRHLVTGYYWQESGNFPRVTMCDFEVRKLANMHRYTVQCVLPINMFNEKIFLFLWFWFVFIAMVTLVSCFAWSIKLCVPTSRIHFIRKFLKLKSVIVPADMKNTIEFTLEYLRFDGVLILRMLADNIGDLIAADIVEKLWRQWRSTKGESLTAKVGTDKFTGGLYSSIHLHPCHRAGSTIIDEVQVRNHSRRPSNQPQSSSSQMIHKRRVRKTPSTTTSSSNSLGGATESTLRPSRPSRLDNRSPSPLERRTTSVPPSTRDSPQPTPPTAPPRKQASKASMMKGVENSNMVLDNLQEEDPGEFV